MIRIAILSDIKIYSQGLRHIFDNSGPIRVVGVVGSVERAEDLVSECRPDVVLLDMTMPGSCELAQKIPSLSRRTRIVALAVPYDEKDILRYAQAGISGYVLREASVDELVEAVTRAANGEFYCPPKITACILKKLHNVAAIARARHLAPPRESIQAEAHTDRLTRREIQIAQLLSRGLSNKQIARDLSIEVSTVKNHVHNVLLKLEVKSRSQAILKLQQARLAPPPEPVDADLSMEFYSLSVESYRA